MIQIRQAQFQNLGFVDASQKIVSFLIAAIKDATDFVGQLSGGHDTYTDEDSLTLFEGRGVLNGTD